MCIHCHGFYKTTDLKPDEHICEEVKCGNCKQFVAIKDHQCHMLKKDIKPHSENYMFFDFETKLDRQTNKHVVNYCIVYDFNGTENIFCCIGDFCKWAYVKKHKGYTFVAHYGNVYDFQFIAEWLIDHGIKPHIIHNDQKIIQQIHR